MSAAMFAANLASFALQAAVLVVAGAALARVFRIDDPRAALAYWRTLLLACLVLPFCQPWNAVVPPALETVLTIADETRVATTEPVTAAAPRVWPAQEIVLIVLGAGMALRALWLTVGVFALRRLRQNATPLDPLPACVRIAQERIGAEARMFVSDRISGPITFGLLRPVIVFPPGVSTMATHVQEAITYHELLHVRRRDWVFEVLEEVVRTVLWFHPGIWWLIGRVQLTREQVVDRAAIALTESRDRYLDALLTVATGNSSMLAPASPFLRRHLLKKRVALILQETTMTTRRLIASLTASAAALTLVATVAVRSFPLQAQAQPPSNGAPIQIIRGGDHLLHGELPEYPDRAIAQKVEGDVVIDLDVDDRGEVADARVQSGPEALRRATLESVLRWHYSAAALSSTTTQAVVRFHLPAGDFKKAEFSKAEFSGRVFLVTPDSSSKPGPGEGEVHVGWATTPSQEMAHKLEMERRVEHKIGEIQMGLADPNMPNEQRVDFKLRLDEAKVMIDKIHGNEGELKEVEPEEVAIARKIPFEGDRRLTQIRTERVPEATFKEVLAQAGVSIGDPISEETAKRIRAIAAGIDEHFRVEFGSDHSGGIVLTLLAR